MNTGRFSRKSIVILIVVVVLLTTICCIGVFANRSQPAATVPLPPPQSLLVATPTTPILLIPVIPATQPAIVLVLETPAPVILSTQPFFAGTRWYPYECTDGVPARCTFIQDIGDTAYWSTCLEVEKDRPVTYLDDPNNHDWYLMGQYLILYPTSKGKLQSFQLHIEEGQRK